MTYENLNKVMIEISRLKKAADLVLKGREVVTYTPQDIPSSYNSGHLRRASMDLSRALAKLRKCR